MSRYKKVSHCPTCKCNDNDSSYEFFSFVHEDSVSDYPAPIDELPGGKVFVSLDVISDTEKEGLWKRFGPAQNRDDD